jgi:nicotinamidase-related amidase
MARKSDGTEKNISVNHRVRPALLIIDTQNKYLKIIQSRDKELAIYFINLLITLFRENKYPVFRIYHSEPRKSENPESEEFLYPDSILIRPEDPMIIKTYSDSFNKTKLDAILRKSGSNALFLCGLSAVGCVLATMIGAMNHNYKAFIVKDAIMSHNTEFTKNVEMMFDAVSYNIVKLIVEGC